MEYKPTSFEDLKEFALANNGKSVYFNNGFIIEVDNNNFMRVWRRTQYTKQIIFGIQFTKDCAIVYIAEEQNAGALNYYNPAKIAYNTVVLPAVNGYMDDDANGSYPTKELWRFIFSISDNTREGAECLNLKEIIFKQTKTTNITEEVDYNQLFNKLFGDLF